MEGQSKGNVLLTELVIVVLFFSLIAVTVVQMFVLTHQKGNINAYTQRALIVAQDWAEALSGQPDPESVLLGAGFEKDAEGAYRQTAEGGALRIEARIAPEEQTAVGRLVGAEIRVVYTKDARDPAMAMVLATLPVSSYIPTNAD